MPHAFLPSKMRKRYYLPYRMSDNILELRAHFPILSRSINGNHLIYLDNAATSQKPTCVLDAMNAYYRTSNANAHRGMHVLAEEATEQYEAARSRVQKFIGAKHPYEVIFTKSTTESINLVARTWGEENLKKGDVILLSLLEHHSNIVPWMQLKEKIGVTIEWIGIRKDGTLDEEDARKKLKTGRVKLLALTCVSNVLGVRTPFEALTNLAHEQGAIVLLDAAQLAPHAPIDVQTIGCDFLAFSGHKIYGPTGIGVLYGRSKILEAMPPFLGGGGMIGTVTWQGFTAAENPQKFEAGTPPIAEAVGLHAALDFLEGIGWKNIQEHEQELIAHALTELGKMEDIHILGPKDASKILGCISFTLQGIHPHDLTDWLGKKGVCLRAGHHCTQPLHAALHVPATTRMSCGIYNTKEEVELAVHLMHEASAFFNHEA